MTGACLEFAQVCRYFKQSPLYWIQQEFDDPVAQFMVMQGMMIRLNEFDRQQQEEEERKREQERLLKERQSVPVAQREPVARPTAEEIRQQLGIE